MALRKKFKVVMIGAGARSNQVIYPSLSSMVDVDIAAICDTNKEHLNGTADKYGVDRRYGESKYDYQRMIKEIQPDAVFAIGQPHIFYDIWMWCLEQRLNLCIEKPMALTIHQARSLAYIAEKKRCITQVTFQRRYTPMVVKLREECLKRGPIVHAVCKFYKCSINPLLGAMDNMMGDSVHAIDILRWICGGEVVKIESHVKRVQVPNINFISATLHFDNGSSGYLLNSWSSGKRIFEVEMHAPNIFVEAELEGKGYLYANGDTKGIEFDTIETAGSNAFYEYTGVKAVCRQFVDCCRAGKQPDTNFADAVKTMEIAEKILAQALLEGK